MSKGIYTKDFLFEYRYKAKRFECFDCKLVSPKNYLIECKHCICQNCLNEKEYEICPFDNNKIIFDGKYLTAFQFVILENILNPFIMKCIFHGCSWAGKYQNFIENHYDKCKYKKNERLLNEYFSNFKEKKKKKPKSEIKVVNKKIFKNNNYKEKNKSFCYDSSKSIVLNESEDEEEQDIEENEYNSKNNEEEEFIHLDNDEEDNICNLDEYNENECNEEECNEEECNEDECNENDCNEDECNEDNGDNEDECNDDECNEEECNEDECNEDDINGDINEKKGEKRYIVLDEDKEEEEDEENEEEGPEEEENENVLNLNNNCYIYKNNKYNIKILSSVNNKILEEKEENSESEPIIYYDFTKDNKNDKTTLRKKRKQSNEIFF